MPVHNLATQSTEFVGRSAELAEIAQLLADPACRLLTLLGPGGIGKTRLAIEAATLHGRKFVDGVFMVGLAPVGSSHLLSAAIAAALSVSLYGTETPDTQTI